LKKQRQDKANSNQHTPATNKVEGSSLKLQFPKLTNKSVVDAIISGLDDEGYGISCSETHALRIAGALPGDTVRAGIDHVAQRIAFGHVKKILVPSPGRSKRPPCSDSALCLGCPLVAMKYRDQMEWKRQFILNQLRQYRELGEITVHPLLSPLRLIHYRTTARLAIAGKHSVALYRHLPAFLP